MIMERGSTGEWITIKVPGEDYQAFKPHALPPKAGIHWSGKGPHFRPRGMVSPRVVWLMTGCWRLPLAVCDEEGDTQASRSRDGQKSGIPAVSSVVQRPLWGLLTL